jgi:uncharacterized Zn-binding protein involved in type VI secretion
MGSPIFHVGAQAMCPHGGQVSTVPGSPRVSVGGQPVATMADTYLIAGCAFMVGTKPQPCMKAQWLVPATRVTVGGLPVILQSSSGLCQSAEQIPGGPPSVVMTQLRVTGT